MGATVVYESVYGNTRTIAEAIAEGLRDAELVAVQEVADRVSDTDLLVVGGPTHMHGITTTRSREIAVQAAHEDGSGRVEPGAADEPGLRAWLRDLPSGEGGKAAAFDTRADKSPWLTGAASHGIAKRLRRRGYEVVSRQSFLVEDSEGPLAEGELARARDWGRKLAELLPVGAGVRSDW
jgi:flavodoxin